MSRWIRTTITPSVEILVDDGEWARLAAMGLIYGVTTAGPPDPDDVEVAGFLDDETSQTYARLLAQLATAVGSGSGVLPDALRAAFGRLPPHAGVRAGVYDPTHSIYNLKSSNSRRARAALAAARAGTGLCRLTFAGDSLTAGYGNTRGVDDAVSQLRAELGRRGYGVGELVHFHTGGLPEPRIVLGGSWSLGGPTFPWAAGAAANTATLTGTGTVLEIVGSGFGGSWTYAIDGAAPVTIVPNGASVPQITVVTGLSNAAHTVVCTANAPDSYIYGLGFRQATGVALENAAISGSSTSSWLDATNWPFGAASSLFSATSADHDIVLLELGVNDLGAGSTVDAYRTRLGQLVDAVRARSSASVFLVASNYPQGADATWAPFVSAAYDVADLKDAPLLDLADRWGSFGQYNADGLARDLASDTVHLTAAGNAAKMRAWLDLLAV